MSMTLLQACQYTMAMKYMAVTTTVSLSIYKNILLCNKSLKYK